MKLALALIVKPTDEEAEFLKRALNNIAPHVDGIFVTITGKNKKIEDICKAYGVNTSYYKWDYSFANARNFNFKQVPKEYDYILWVDADDMLRGAELLKGIINQNLDCDGFTLNYLYAFDEYNNPVVVHLKTQIIKNDGCVQWAGDLHEDFKQNRELKIKFIKGVERIHASSETRFEQNKERNLEISKKIVKKESKDPRSYWNLGNSQKALGLHKEAIESFDKFLGMSKSEEEKYIVLLRMSEIYLIEKDFANSLESIILAIGTKPEYPDAYHLRGRIFFEMKDWIKGSDSFLLGFK